MLRTFHQHSALRMIEPMDLYRPSEDEEVVQGDLVASVGVEEAQVGVAVVLEELAILLLSESVGLQVLALGEDLEVGEEVEEVVVVVLLRLYYLSLLAV